MKAIIRSSELKRIVKATAKFISKNENRPMLQYIKLEFNKEKMKVKAIAVDGYKASIEEASCMQLDEDFTAYIKPNLPSIGKNSYSTVEIVNDDCLINIEGRITGCTQPKGNFLDVVKIIKETTESPVSAKIAVNPEYLINALNSSKVSRGTQTREPVIIEFRGPAQPLILKDEYGTRMVLPIRYVE